MMRLCEPLKILDGIAAAFPLPVHGERDKVRGECFARGHGGRARGLGFAGVTTIPRRGFRYGD
jgi:hypothetical protein